MSLDDEKLVNDLQHLIDFAKKAYPAKRIEPLGPNDDPLVWYWKNMSPEERQRYLDDRERESREVIRSDPPKRLSARFQNEDWMFGITLLFRWNARKSFSLVKPCLVRNATLDLGLPIYLVNLIPNEVLPKPVYWKDDPKAFAKQEPFTNIPKLEAQSLAGLGEHQRQDVESIHKILMDHPEEWNYMFMSFHIDDVTFLEKLHPDTWENSLEHWLSFDELCQYLKKTPGETRHEVMVKEIPEYYLKPHCEVRRVSQGLFLCGSDAIFKRTDIDRIYKQRKRNIEDFEWLKRAVNEILQGQPNITNKKLVEKIQQKAEWKRKGGYSDERLLRLLPEIRGPQKRGRRSKKR